MVYSRSYRGRSMRRRRGGRRSYKRYPRRPMTPYRVKRLINAELKFAVFGNDFLEFPAVTGSVIALTTPIAEGTGASERVGNWLHVTNIHGTLVVKGNPAAMPAIESFSWRMGIVQWNNDQSVDPATVAKIMFDSAAPLGPLSIVNRGSFKLCWSRTGTVMNDDDNTLFLKTLRCYVKLARYRKTLYAGVTPKKYQYFFFIVSDSIGLESPLYQLDLTTRYTDS